MSFVIIFLSIKAEATAPVPAKISATVFIFLHSFSTTLVINGSNLYLLPKYLRLFILVVLYSFGASLSSSELSPLFFFIYSLSFRYASSFHITLPLSFISTSTTPLSLR